MGGSLTRVAVVGVTDEAVMCATRRVGPAAHAGGCDACVGAHSPKEIRCSMNNGAATWHEDGVLYDFATRLPMAGWRLVDARQPRGCRGTAVWHPPAGDQTHAALITQGPPYGHQ